MNHQTASVGWMVLCVVALTHPAYAQQDRLTVSAGYQDMVYTIGGDGGPLPPGFVWWCPDRRRGCDFTSASYSVHGLYADVAAQVSRNVAIAGEWLWNRSGTAGLFGGDPDLVIPGLTVSVHQLTAGPRLSIRRGRWVPFAHVLVGVARVAAKAPGVSESVAVADLRIGGGIDLMLNDVVGFRGSAGYTHVFTSDIEHNDLAQFGLGLVLKY